MVKIISEVRNHGYLQEKRPYFSDADEVRSYLAHWESPHPDGSKGISEFFGRTGYFEVETGLAR